MKVIFDMRGRPSDADARKFLAASCGEKNIFGIILGVGANTLSDCVNHIFHSPVDGVFASRASKAA